MEIAETELPGVLSIQPTRFGDERGWFNELDNPSLRARLGVECWVQDNESMSAVVGTVRGLHFQQSPHAQGKLVRAVRGALFDVAVDIRPDSPHHGRWVGRELTADGGEMLWVPPGFAHGFVTREPRTVIHYRVTHLYTPAAEVSIAWDDPAIGVDWGLVGVAPTLSDRDRAAPTLAETVVVTG